MEMSSDNRTASWSLQDPNRASGAFSFTQRPTRAPISSNIAPAAPKRSAQLCVLIRKVQHVLRQTRRLDHAPNLQRALVLDESTNRLKQRG